MRLNELSSVVRRSRPATDMTDDSNNLKKKIRTAQGTNQKAPFQRADQFSHIITTFTKRNDRIHSLLQSVEKTQHILDQNDPSIIMTVIGF